jgi:hypothetical protein
VRREVAGESWLTPENVAALGTCGLIIIGGLLVFWRLVDRWSQLSIQTLGTIFFFPTLILLGIYIDLSRDAITTILGAFVGYLFNQNRGARSDGYGGGDGETPPDRPVRPRSSLTRVMDRLASATKAVAGGAKSSRGARRVKKAAPKRPRAP